MDEVFLIVCLALIVGGCAVFKGCTEHSEKLECIKQHGEWVKDACKPADPKPTAPR